jgi:TRAP-type uncharacterized transport system fused permease subunit
MVKEYTHTEIRGLLSSLESTLHAMVVQAWVCATIQIEVVISITRLGNNLSDFCITW